MATTDARARLDSDNAERYAKLANDLDAPRDWVINQVLRAIQAVEIGTTAVMSDTAAITKGGKTLVIKKRQSWAAKI
jgi:predicted transcriptional regulator